MRLVRRAALIPGAALLIGLFAAPRAVAQQDRSAVALSDLVQGLGATARVLMIGAHPDDEDTFLLSWLARGRHVETAYLSLTRGEGGQNLIGNELGGALGIIRTEELLAARRIDGAHQYFTRAYDFGYSKSLAETDSVWPRPVILKDVVTIIRAFRPHVIVAVWSGTEADGHGHHQYAGVLAKEAFESAADSTRFPSRTTSGLSPWQPLKLYRRARSGGTLTFNVGEYSPIFGRSYAELAALSRSQHLSQGMGTLLPLGPMRDGVRLDTSRVQGTGAGAGGGTAERSLFDGIDTTWGRFASLPIAAPARAALDSLPAAIAAARAMFDARDPAPMTKPLARVLRLARIARDSIACSEFLVARCGGPTGDLAASLNTTIERATQALLVAAGVTVDALGTRERVAVDDTVGVSISVYNRGKSRVELRGGSLSAEGKTVDLGSLAATVLPDSALHLGGVVTMDRVGYPWWMTNGLASPTRMYFRLADEVSGSPVVAELVIGDDRVASSSVSLLLRIDETDVTATVGPIVYRFADPARGELRRPIVAVPRVSALAERQVEYARARVPFDRFFRVSLQSGWSNVDTVTVSLTLPPGLRADSASRRVVLPASGAGSVFFRVTGTPRAGGDTVRAVVRDRSQQYRQGYVEIEYSHIRPIRVYRRPEFLLSSVDVDVPANLSVAYVRGVGDNIHPALEQLGIQVKVIPAEMLPVLDNAQYTTLVIGPRAYESNPALAANAAAVLEFAKKGGTVVVQYGQYEMLLPGVLPFPITLGRPAARVADEKAAVTVLDPTHKLMTVPNRITSSDFANWIQERALYMPSTFDPRYTALLSMHDPEEPPNSGGLLVTPVGKGMFVYTTMSFFRQIPNGHPGAARLLVNLLSAGLVPRGPIRP